MVIASGIGGQAGFAEEVTYGTYVAPTRFLEFEKESIKVDIGKIRAAGIGGGRFNRINYSKTYIKGAAGSVEWILQNKGFALLLKHCLGAVATAGPTASAYTHTLSPDANALKGKSLTFQIGRPDIDGTSRVFSFLGGKITAWELSAQLDAAARLRTDFDFKTCDVGQSLAAAAYPSSPEILTFVDGALTVGGPAKSVSSIKIGQQNALKTDRRFLGNAKKEPLANGISTVTGEFVAEFESLADYNAAVAGTQAALVLTFTSVAEISAGVPFLVTVTIPAIEFLNAEPSIEGPDVLKATIPFMALKGASDIISIAYKTSEATP
ncbi:MAG: hypothetical protein E6Q97_08215 [Desulfurellales bacterium]|nr:MAG: hypothetical protein E6Q97_08215 [Desulfurellales bacterium]